MYEYMTSEQKDFYIEMKNQFITVLGYEYKLSHTDKKEYINVYKQYSIEVNRYNEMVQTYNKKYNTSKTFHKKIEPKQKIDNSKPTVKPIGVQCNLF